MLLDISKTEVRMQNRSACGDFIFSFNIGAYCSRVDYNVVRLYLLCSYSVRTAVHINYEFMMMIIEINLEANKVNDLNE